MSEVDAAEHLAWAKARALEHVDAGDLLQGVTSMLSDLGKHPDLAGYRNPFLSRMGLVAAQARDAQAVRDWIEGFKG